MDDIEKREENLSEEIDALLLVWDVDPTQINSVILSNAIKHIMSSIYSFTAVIDLLQKIKSSLSGTELEKNDLAIEITGNEIKRLMDTLQKLLPQVPKREFILGFIGVVKGLDSVLHPEDE